MDFPNLTQFWESLPRILNLYFISMEGLLMAEPPDLRIVAMKMCTNFHALGRT
jgi:hypothetical protein